MGYWQDRMLDAQKNYSDKSIDEVDEQLKKYYKKAMISTINDFEAVYDKVLNQAEEGKPITPADLYKLDKYYQMQAQLNKRLQKLGDKQCNVMSKQFQAEYKHIYVALTDNKQAITAMVSDAAWSTIDEQAAKQVANQIWCADGKSWSQRVWGNLDELQQTLNDGLIDCVVSGKKTSELKKLLMERFNVSYHRAQTITRTEIAHIETQAAKDRYKSYGIKQVEILADTDNRTCDICARLDHKIISINDKMPIPVHPNCRCCIVPVVRTVAEEKQEAIARANADIIKHDYKPLEMGAIDKKKLDKMIERENVADNEVVFWKFENRKGKVFYSTEYITGFAYDFYDDEKEYHYYRDADILARRKQSNDYKQIKFYPEKDNRYFTVNYYKQNENESGILEDMTYKERYETNNTQFAQCIDCYRIFRKSNPKSNAAKRCPECQAAYRKKYKAEKEKERRKKNK